MEDWKVLLVDDEVEFVSTLAERLSLRGIHVQVAYDGREALERMQSDPPGVVVVDRMMPGMSGMELLERIRTQYPHIPVILVTGQGADRDGGEGAGQGAFDCLMKPLRIEELIESIRKAVNA